MRIVMIGTGPFAAPTFHALLDSPHEIVALVTAPPRFCRGKPVVAVCPMREIACHRGMAIFDPEDINAPDSVAWLAAQAADVLVVCDYGQILSRQALAAARLGGVNLHGSLLPKYRGAAPINWAIYHGEAETGVTVIHMTPQVDAGPCVARAATPIDPDETAVELEARLCRMGAPLVLEALDLIASGRAVALPQDPTLVSRAPRLKKTDGLLDWTRPAAALKNHVRAMEPWPKTHTFWHRPCGEPLRLILGPIDLVDPVECPAKTPPGTVLEACDGRLLVAAGEGVASIRSVQPCGKRMLSADEFLRGYPVRPGDRFGPERTT